MTQRTNGFKGGIQAGTSATNDQSRSLDSSLTDVRKLLTESYKSSEYSCIYRIPKEERLTNGIFCGCQPDGGVWFKGSQAKAAFEGKKQGAGGNAIERWAVNKDFLYRLYPSIRYVTFGIGDGFVEGNSAFNLAKSYLQNGREFNILYPDGISWFINVEGFTKKEIRDIMERAIEM
jgi:hypothetical protein